MKKKPENNGVKKLQIDMTEDELYSVKQAALDSRITLTKYVRLKLGLDKKETK